MLLQSGVVACVWAHARAGRPETALRGRKRQGAAQSVAAGIEPLSIRGVRLVQFRRLLVFKYVASPPAAKELALASDL